MSHTPTYVSNIVLAKTQSLVEKEEVLALPKAKSARKKVTTTTGVTSGNCTIICKKRRCVNLETLDERNSYSKTNPDSTSCA